MKTMALAMMVALYALCISKSAKANTTSELMGEGTGYGRYVYVGDFETGSPFQWDHDSLNNQRFGFYQGVSFYLNRGVDVEIGELTVTCDNGRVCYRARLSLIANRQYPVEVRFQRPLRVRTITVVSKPRGISFPASRVETYLF